MKIAQPRNSPVNQQRRNGWLSAFDGYRHAITEHALTDWLAQFPAPDRDIGARLLDCVEFFPVSQLASLFRQVLAALPGWHAQDQQRQGRWAFSAFSSSAGESGDSMLHKFRMANDLGGKKYRDMFLHRSELLSAGLGPDDSLVFVDDFAGTGRQVVEAWEEYFHEVVPETKLYLVLAAATSRAVERISTETPLMVNPGFQFDDSDNVFHDACVQFTDVEKQTILRLCRRANAANPKGFGDCGLLAVFAHNTPNNSIPILHAVNARWTGLFRRFD